MKVWFWIRDFQAFETEVQMIMDFKVRKVKIWVHHKRIIGKNDCIDLR